MPMYEFQSCTHKRCKSKGGVVIMPFSMKEVPGLGEKVLCPVCCKGMITRILSSGVMGIVRGTENVVDTSHGKSYMCKIEGKDHMVTFVDHPEGDPRYEAGLARIAKAQGMGGMSKAYRRPDGQLAVDVVSDIPDPLGRMARGEGFTKQTQTRKVAAPYKLRKFNPVKAKPTDRIPIRPSRAV